MVWRTSSPAGSSRRSRRPDSRSRRVDGALRALRVPAISAIAAAGASCSCPACTPPGSTSRGSSASRATSRAWAIAVLTVELPDLAHYEITSRTTDMIEDAAVWMLHRAEYRGPDGRDRDDGHQLRRRPLDRRRRTPVDCRDSVAFVMSFGGHGDLPRTLRYLCTGHSAGRRRASAARLRSRDRPAQRRRRVVPATRCSRCATRSCRFSKRRGSTWSTRSKRPRSSHARRRSRPRSASRRTPTWAT